MLLRRQVFVFVSSSMREFEEVRGELEARLTEIGGVESWFFEFHAVASGAPPEVQYLDYARSCDLFVLVLGRSESVATMAEYRAAFEDNPQKILPFYFGPTSPEIQPFRDLVDQRHSRVLATKTDQLLGSIVAAVDEAVALGTPVVNELCVDLERRIHHLENFVQLLVQLTFVPLVDVRDQEAQLLASVAMLDENFVLTGPGGSGKTFASIVQLLKWARSQPQRLPLYLRADAEEANATSLIKRGLGAMRFYPGDDLVERYGREGRLLLVFDGVDELSDDLRGAYLDSVERFAARFPRCKMLFLTRRLPDERLASFEKLRMSPLSQDAILDFLEVQGYPPLGQWDIPAEIRDLVAWPLWIQMFAKFGAEAGSALSLLQRLVDYRLQRWKATEGLRLKTRQVLSELALSARPGVVISRSEATERLAEWSLSPTTTARFNVEPAEKMIDSALATGLVEAEGQALIFIHPLIGTYIAAEGGASRSSVPELSATDRELAAFLAPMLDEARAEDFVAVLCQHDIFTLARTLRLTRPKPRRSNIEGDIARFDRAFSALAGLAGFADTLEGTTTLALLGGPWIAVGRVVGDCPRVATVKSAEHQLDTLFPTGFVYWDANPFNTRSPELVAAAEVLAKFKERFVAMRPLGDPHGDYREVDVEAEVRAPEALENRVFAFLDAYNLAKRRFAAAVSLSNNKLVALGEREPIATLFVHGESSRVRVDWGQEQRTFVIHQEDPDYRGYPLQTILDADPDAVAYDELKKEVEREIGSSIRSQAWSKPYLLAGWAW